MTDRELEIEAVILSLRAMIETARKEEWEELVSMCADLEMDASCLARGEASDPMQDKGEPASLDSQDRGEPNPPGRWADYWDDRSL